MPKRSSDEQPPLRKFDSHEVAKAMAHPVRVRILKSMERMGIASPRELSRTTGIKLENLAYHVRALRDFGLIELHETRLVRGTVEHRYRIVARPWLSEDAFEALPKPVREALVAASLDDAWLEAAAAYQQGGMDRPKGITARLGWRVDHDGHEELSDILMEAVAKMNEAAARAHKRLEAGAEAVPQTAVVLLFDTPDMENINWSAIPLHRRPSRHPAVATTLVNGPATDDGPTA